jgi:hypothetical protein
MDSSINFTAVCAELRRKRVVTDKSWAHSARELHTEEEFMELFSYRKGGKKLVLQKDSDIARREQGIKQAPAYWDREDSDDE